MKENLSIKTWSEQDRPREKMIATGRQSLTDSELVAILIGSGSRQESAVDLSKRILKSVNSDLNELGRMSLKDLMIFKGIGEAKAISIAAALELGRRRQATDYKEKPKITISQDAYKIIAPLIDDLEIEQFWIILLNRGNYVISKKRISEGGVSGTVVDSKIIFKTALDALASQIICVHNHPSGNLKASRADRNLTDKLVAAGKVMDISVIDHLIISQKGYTSFRDEGWI